MSPESLSEIAEALEKDGTFSHLFKAYPKSLLLGYFKTPKLSSVFPIVDKNLEGSLRRQKMDLGVWQEEQVMNLARTMICERRFGTIRHAGELLLRNQQKELSFSEVSTVFIEAPVSLNTRSSEPGMYWNALTRCQTNGENINFAVKSKKGDDDFIFSAPPKLHITEIAFKAEGIQDLSNLGFKFLVTKEVYNIISVDLIVEIFLSGFSLIYDVHSEENLRNAIKVGMIAGNWPVKKVINFLAEMWAYFLIIPDFGTAKKRGVFTDSDMRSFWKEDELFNFFTRTRVLNKNKRRDYVWDLNNPDSLKNGLLEATYRFYPHFIPHSTH